MVGVFTMVSGDIQWQT